MKLLDYLNNNFGEVETQELTSHFLNVFGVDVKNESDLFLFKYNMLAAQYDKDITKQCRGAIMRYANGQWRVASMPFDKFFNVGEVYCTLTNENEFCRVTNQLCYSQKADGTCIQVWYDDDDNRWRVSTLGTITTTNVSDLPITFEQLFYSCLGVGNVGFGCRDYTYIFELCTQENRILTKYDCNRVYLLAIRDKNNGEYVVGDEFNDAYCSLLSTGASIQLPVKHNKVFASHQELFDWVEAQANDVAQYGEYSEGFVAYLDNVPVAKIKNSTYLKYHHVTSGDIKHSRNIVIQHFFSGELDDTYSVLVNSLKNFADNLKIVVENSCNDVTAIAEKYFTGQKIDTQKEYALLVQQHVDKMFWGFFFANKQEIMSGNTKTVFLQWLKDNATKLNDYWKNKVNEK